MKQVTLCGRCEAELGDEYFTIQGEACCNACVHSHMLEMENALRDAHEAFDELERTFPLPRRGDRYKLVVKGMARTLPYRDRPRG